MFSIWKMFPLALRHNAKNSHVPEKPQSGNSNLMMLKAVNTETGDSFPKYI